MNHAYKATNKPFNCTYFFIVWSKVSKLPVNSYVWSQSYEFTCLCYLYSGECFPFFFSYKNKIPVFFSSLIRIEMTRVYNRGSGTGDMMMLLVPNTNWGSCNDCWLSLRIRCSLSGLKGTWQCNQGSTGWVRRSIMPDMTPVNSVFDFVAMTALGIKIYWLAVAILRNQSRIYRGRRKVHIKKWFDHWPVHTTRHILEKSINTES